MLCIHFPSPPQYLILPVFTIPKLLTTKCQSLLQAAYSVYFQILSYLYIMCFGIKCKQKQIDESGSNEMTKALTKTQEASTVP